MKNFTKISLIVTVLFAALCLISCSNTSNSGSSSSSGGGSSSSSNPVASFKGTITESGKNKEITFKFYNDSSWTWNEGNGTIKGTYTGDVTKDGEGTMTLSFDDRTQDYCWKLAGNEFKWGASGYYVFTFTKI